MSMKSTKNVVKIFEMKKNMKNKVKKSFISFKKLFFFSQETHQEMPSCDIVSVPAKPYSMALLNI